MSEPRPAPGLSSAPPAAKRVLGGAAASRGAAGRAARGGGVALTDPRPPARAGIVQLHARGEDGLAQRLGIAMGVDVDAAVLEDHVAQAAPRPGPGARARGRG